MRSLAELRRRRFMTQTELANKIGVSMKSVQKWEAGSGLPRLRTIPKLAEVLDISTDDLLEVLNAKMTAQMSLEASCAA